MITYETLGVRTTLNAWGTVTRVGGSRMPPSVVAAMAAAAESFVDMGELHAAAGREVARLLGAEAACVTCGATAGLAVATAACMTRGAPAAILQLPDTTGMRDEVLVLKAHRILYDQAVLLAGASFVEVGVTSSASAEQVRAAVTERTAMLLYVAEAAGMRGSLPLEEVRRALDGTGIPLVVDAAAELPPAAAVASLLDQGADLVVVSGGKEIRGPQSSGAVLGDATLVAWCAANAFPNYGVGRSMKSDKETIVGLVEAVRLFAARDHEAIGRQWEEMTDRVVEACASLPGCDARKGFPVEPGVQPADIPRAFLRPLRTTAAELHARLIASEPSVTAGIIGDELVINPQCLTLDEVDEVIVALRRHLR